MRTILRGVRKKLFKEKRIKKYLLYAVGEIVLVVIGILIAFQLNNWNQNRSARKVEEGYYKSIREQLFLDRQAINDQIVYNRNFLDRFFYANKIINSGNREEIDTLGLIALDLTAFSDFRRKSSVYQTLVNSGEIKLISNRDVVSELQDLEEVYIYIDRLESTHSEAILTLVVPEIKNIVQIEPLKVMDTGQLYSYRFKNNISLLTQLMKEKNQVYKRAEKQLSSTIALVEQQVGEQ